MQQFFSVRAQCIRSDSASRVQRHAADNASRVQGIPKGTSCGRVTHSCKIILVVFMQKEYQQFRLKKAGRCRSKTFSDYQSRESRVQRHAAVTLPSRCPRKSIFKKITTYNVILRSLATKNLSDIAVFVKKILRLCSG